MILVTGASGMTAKHLPEVYSESELFRTDLVESIGIRKLDVRDSDAITRTMGEIRPSLVLHLAAETDLERCEREVPHVVVACKKCNVDLVYVSTAGLFDGNQIAARCLELRDKAEIQAVDDEFGSPTYAKDLLATVKRLSGSGHYGLYHAVNSGPASRYDVALEIDRILRTGSNIVRSTAASFPSVVTSPRSAVLENHKLDLLGFPRMRTWRDALADYLALFPSS